MTGNDAQNEPIIPPHNPVSPKTEVAASRGVPSEHIVPTASPAQPAAPGSAPHSEAPIKKDLADHSIESTVEHLQVQGRENFQKLADELANQQISQSSGEKSNVLSRKFAIKPLRTFQGDAAEIIKSKNESLITMKLAEDEKKEKEGAPRKPPPVQTDTAHYSVKTVSIGLSLLLILTGISTLFVFQYYAREQNHRTSTIVFDTIMPYDSEEVLRLGTREEVLSAFDAARSGTVLPAEHVKHMRIVSNSQLDAGSSFSDFLDSLRSQAPQPLVRSLGDTFMAGLYSTGETNNAFLIVNVTSFDNAFSGMLAWESTMGKDIGGLFTSDPIGEAGAIENATPASTGTGTPAAPEGLARQAVRPFDDLLVQNIDTRVLRNSEGRIAMLYSFVDKNTLLITTDEAAFKGVLAKLRAARLIR